MSRREYTVKMRPEVGSQRVQLWPLVPAEFLVGHPGSGSIVEVELLKIVGAYTHGKYEMPECVHLQLQAGDHPYGWFETYGNAHVCGSISMKLPSRQGWNVILSFYYGGYGAHYFDPNSASPQRDGTDRHVVVRVSSRPA